MISWIKNRVDRICMAWAITRMIATMPNQEIVSMAKNTMTKTQTESVPESESESAPEVPHG